MHDAFLKLVFADRRMVEILIRDHVPEWAAKIDFSTLHEESTGLVSRRAWPRSCRRCGGLSRRTQIRAWMDSWSGRWLPC